MSIWRQPTRATWTIALAGALACASVATLAPSASPATAAEFGPANAPSGVVAQATSSGVRVTWEPAPPSNPPITRYVVHAGPDSCPVVVPAAQLSATMPYIAGPKTVTPKVQAINAYGFSIDATGNAVPNAKKATPGFRNVQFLEFSDFHGAIESSGSSIGAARLAHAFAADRRTVKSTFTVSGGDNIGGSPVISSQFGELPTIEALNLMGLDISTFGNHEHDLTLPKLRTIIDHSNFEWVASDYASLAPLQGKRQGAKPFTLIEHGGVTVGFIGLNTADLAVRVPESNLMNGTRVAIAIDDSKVAQRIASARAAGAQLVVALVHRGWNTNASGQALGPLVDAAAMLKGADLVFGGDSHQQFASLYQGIPVVESPNSGQMYSRVIQCLDTRTGKVIGSSVDFLSATDLAATPEDPKVTRLVKRYQAELGKRLDGVVGKVDGVFARGGTPPVERSGEAALGDVVADAVRRAYGTDFALINGGSLRDSLPASGATPQNSSLRRPGPGTSGPYDITLGDLYAVLPFQNALVTTTITGANLWNALENGVSNWPADGRFPQVSGLRYAFDSARPKGSRITSVTKVDGAPIARDGVIYTIATQDFIVNGGDGYGGFLSRSDAVVHEPMLDAVVSFFKADLAAGRVTAVPAADGRIAVAH